MRAGTSTMDPLISSNPAAAAAPSPALTAERSAARHSAAAAIALAAAALAAAALALAAGLSFICWRARTALLRALI